MDIRIMFADDNLDIRNLLQAIFELFDDGTTVELAQNGQEAVNLVKSSERPFDIVLLDYQMPPGNDGGVWTAREIREIEPDVPIVFVSAYTDPQKRDFARQMGAVAYVSKEVITDPSVVTEISRQRWDELPRAAGEAGSGDQVWVFKANLAPPDEKKDS